MNLLWDGLGSGHNIQPWYVYSFRVFVLQEQSKEMEK